MLNCQRIWNYVKALGDRNLKESSELSNFYINLK